MWYQCLYSECQNSSAIKSRYLLLYVYMNHEKIKRSKLCSWHLVWSEIWKRTLKQKPLTVAMPSTGNTDAFQDLRCIPHIIIIKVLLSVHLTQCFVSVTRSCVRTQIWHTHSIRVIVQTVTGTGTWALERISVDSVLVAVHVIRDVHSTAVCQRSTYNVKKDIYWSPSLIGS